MGTAAKRSIFLRSDIKRSAVQKSKRVAVHVAMHESATGPKCRFAASQRHVRESGEKPTCQDNPTDAIDPERKSRLALDADVIAEHEERCGGDLIGLGPCGVGRTVPFLDVDGAVADDARGSREVHRLVA